MKKILISIAVLLTVIQAQFTFKGWDANKFFIPDTLFVGEYVGLDSGSMLLDTLFLNHLGHRVLIVGEDSKFAYNTVDSAVNQAIAGDLILVLPGSYSGHIDADVANITIRSLAGPEWTTLALAMSGQSGIELNGDGIVLSGFTLTGDGAGSVIEVQNSSDNVIVENCIIDLTGSSTMGYSITTAGASGPIIRNNIFLTNSADGAIWINKTVDNMQIYGNEFFGQDSTNGYAIQAAGFNNWFIYNNVIKAADGYAGGFSSGIMLYSASSGGAISDSVYIFQNDIAECDKAIHIGHTSQVYDVTDFFVHANTLHNNEFGVYVSSDANNDPSTFVLSGNIYYDNATADIRNAHATPLAVGTHLKEFVLETDSLDVRVATIDSAYVDSIDIRVATIDSAYVDSLYARVATIDSLLVLNWLKTDSIWSATDLIIGSTGANTVTIAGFDTWDFGAVTTVDYDGDYAVTGGNANWSQNYIVNEQGAIDKNSMPAPVLSFDGDGDYVQYADNANLDMGTNDFTLRIKIKPVNVTDTGKRLISKTSATFGYELVINEDDLQVAILDNTNNVTLTNLATAIFTAGVWSEIVVTFDRDGNIAAYENYVAVGTPISCTATATIDNGEVLRIGTETGGVTNEFNGEIDWWKLDNRIYSADEVLALGAPTPNSDVGASQTALVTGDDSDMDTAGNWVGESATLTGGHNDGGVHTACLRIESNDGVSDRAVLAQGNFTTITVSGKLYRLKFDYRFVTAPTVDPVVQVGGVNFDNLDKDNSSWTAYSSESRVVDGTSDLKIFVNVGSGGSAADELLIDNVLLTQIGLIDVWDASGMTAGMWYGRYGHDGAVTGATLLHLSKSQAYRNYVLENGDGGRESIMYFEGYKADGNMRTLGEMEVSHDGAGDDYKGKWILRLNDGDDAIGSLTQVLEIGSDLLATFAGAISSVGMTVTGQVTVDSLTALNWIKTDSIWSAGAMEIISGADMNFGVSGSNYDYQMVINGIAATNFQQNRGSLGTPTNSSASDGHQLNFYTYDSGWQLNGHLKILDDGSIELDSDIAGIGVSMGIVDIDSLTINNWLKTDSLWSAGNLNIGSTGANTVTWSGFTENDFGAVATLSFSPTAGNQVIIMNNSLAGSDIAGTDILIKAGPGRGNGDVGIIEFWTPKVQSSGSDLQVASALMTLDESLVTIDGSIDIGGTSLLQGDVTIQSTTPTDLIIDNSTAGGADANSGHIILRGNDGAGNTELQMSAMLEVNTTTDYYWAWYNDNKGTEVGSIDQDGNFQADGTGTFDGGMTITGQVTVDSLTALNWLKADSIWSAAGIEFGSVNDMDFVSSGAGFNFTTDTDAGDDFIVGSASFPSGIVFEGDNGFVGIGTAAPAQLLEVEKSQDTGTWLRVDNPLASSNTAAFSALALAADGGAVTIRAHSSGFTTSNQYIQDAGIVESESVLSGGLVISSAHGTADLTFWTNQEKRWSIDGATGLLTAESAGSNIKLQDGGGIGTATTPTSLTFASDGDLTAAVDMDVVGALTAGTGVTDTDFTVGVLANDVLPVFSIVGDAENDNATPISTVASLVLIQNATPALAFWRWTTTTSTVGMDFDMPVTATSFVADAGVSGTVITASTSVNLGDDDLLYFGASSDATILYETADADAKVLMFLIDESDDSGNNVPAFVFAEETGAGGNLGLLDGIVEPAVVVLNLGGGTPDAYVALDAGDINGTENGLYFNPAADEEVTLIKVGVTDTPRIHWDETADAFESSKGWNITGATDVDGALVVSSLTSDAGLLIADGATIGNASVNTITTYQSDGDVLFAQDIEMANGKSIGIDGAEIITFNTAGSINITGATFDVDGAATATSYTADAAVIATTTMTTGANSGTSGQLNFIASDNDQGNISISVDDRLLVTDFSGGMDLAAGILMIGGDQINPSDLSTPTAQMVDPAALEIGAGTTTQNDTYYALKVFSSSELDDITSTTDSTLTINTSGLYFVSWSVSFDFTAGETLHTSFFVDATEDTRLECERKISNPNDVGNMGWCGIVQLTATDVLKIKLRSTGAGVFTPNHANWNIFRIN